jgi:hypothetical protein
MGDGAPAHAPPQKKRQRVKEVFGWVKAVALPRKTPFQVSTGLELAFNEGC